MALLLQFIQATSSLSVGTEAVDLHFCAYHFPEIEKDMLTQQHRQSYLSLDGVSSYQDAYIS